MTNFLPNFTANALFDGTISGLDWLSRTATSLQRGQMRFYLRVMVLCTALIAFLFAGVSAIPIPTFDWNFTGVNGLRLFALLMLTAAALVSVFVKRDLYAVIAIGVSGLGVALWMALDPSPDVALVQVVVDILSTIILILSLTLIPRKLRDRANELLHSRGGMLRDAFIAGVLGLVIAGATYTALETRPRVSWVTPYYAENAKPLTGAKDIVGAVVVDFRGADTWIEILVFSMAALGIYTLLHYSTRKAGDPPREKPDAPLPARTPLGIYNLPTSSLMHTLAYAILPLAFMLGVTHMMYGHDQPGDGFTAGVIISLAVAMWTIIFGFEATRKKLPWLRSVNLIAAGLSVALLNALFSAFFGAGFFAPVDYGALLNLPLPPGFGITNSFLFELAICLTVLGAATLILDNLGHPREEDPAAEADLAALKEHS
jgi:multicomponent K+:H+ antiporter subunit A